MAASRAVALLPVGILLAAILMAHLSAADEGVSKDQFGTRLKPRVRVSVRRLSPEEADARLQQQQPSNNKQPIARGQLVDDSPKAFTAKQLDRSEFMKRQLRINQEMRLRQSRDKKPEEGHNHQHHDHVEQDVQQVHEHRDHGEQDAQQLAPEQREVVQLTPEQQDEQQQLRSELTIGDFVSPTGAQSYYDLPEEPVPFNVPEEPSFNVPEEPSARAEDEAAISEDFQRLDPASEGQQQPDYKYGPPAPQEPPKDHGHGYADASQHKQQSASQDDQATTMMPMDASYTFGYNFPEVSRNEAADPSGNVQGNFTYLDEDGNPLTVSYIAGKGTGVVILRDDRVPAANSQQPAPIGAQQIPVKPTQVHNQPSHSYGPPAQQQQPSSGQNVQIEVKQPPSHSYGPPAQQPAAHGYGDASQQSHHAVPTQHGDSATTMMPMDASYSFGYNLPEGSRNEVADPSGNVEGNFTYIDDTGRPLTVKYKAGKGTGVVILRDDRVPALANGPAAGASQQQPGTYAKPQQPAKPQQAYAPPPQKNPAASPARPQAQQGYPAAQQQRPAPIPRPHPQQQKPAPIPRPQPQQQKPAPIPRPQPQQRPIQPVKAVVVPIRPAISSPLPPKNLPNPKPWPQQQQQQQQQQQPPKPQQQYGPPRPAPQPAKPQQQYQPAAAKPQQQYQPAPARPQQQYGPPRPAAHPPKPQQQYQPAPAKPQQQYGPPKPQRPLTQPAVKPATQHYPKPSASSPPQNHYKPAPVNGGNMMMMPMPYKFSYTGPHGVYRMEQADASGNFVSRYGYNLGPGHTNLMWEQSMGNQKAFPAFSRNEAGAFGGQHGFPQHQQDFTSSGQGQQRFAQSFQPIDLRQDAEGQQGVFSAPSGQAQSISQQDSTSSDSEDQRTFFPVHPSWSQSPGNAPVLNQLPTEDQPLPTLPSHHERAQATPWSNLQQQPADQSASQGDTYNQLTRHDQQATPTGQPSAYSFSYDAGDHRRSESLDPNRVVSGSYSFVGDDGVERTVQYSAGPGTGFVAQGDHLPQPPAVPQQQQVHQHSRRSVRHIAPVVAPWSGTYFIPGGYSYSIRY